MTDVLCAICCEPFTPEEWEERHSDGRIGDVHAACCDQCNASAS